MGADHEIGPELCRWVNDAGNPYRAFLRKFGSAAFISFNYDVLLELLLFRLGAWRPEDGFGVDVSAQRNLPGGGALCSPPVLPDRSSATVLHLHGSYCIYLKKVDWVQTTGSPVPLLHFKDEPEFRFDHYLFPPFVGAPRDVHHVPVSRRVMVPIPDKAEGLKGAFVQRVYERAIAALQRGTRVAAIGYRFNEHDEQSYSPLLDPLAGRSILLVSRDANESVARPKKRAAEHTMEAVASNIC